MKLENAWEGVFDGSGKVGACVQLAWFPGLSFNLNIGSEDCLHLNVYVPEIEIMPKEGLPVMAFIHGGGLHVGDSGDTGCYLILIGSF